MNMMMEDGNSFFFFFWFLVFGFVFGISDSKIGMMGLWMRKREGGGGGGRLYTSDRGSMFRDCNGLCVLLRERICQNREGTIISKTDKAAGH